MPEKIEMWKICVVCVQIHKICKKMQILPVFPTKGKYSSYKPFLLLFSCVWLFCDPMITKDPGTEPKSPALSIGFFIVWATREALLMVSEKLYWKGN